MKNILFVLLTLLIICLLSCTYQKFPAESSSDSSDSTYTNIIDDTLYQKAYELDSNEIYNHPSEFNLNKVLLRRIKGDIHYVLNDTMTVGITDQINMTISHGVDKKVIIAGVETFRNNEIFSDEINISQIMRARLIDPTNQNFTIIPITQEEQFIEDNEYTIWRWDVTPIKEGNHKLILSIDIIIDEESKSIKVYDGEIFVFSDKSFFGNILEFFKEYWELISGLFTIIVIPIFTYFYGKYRKAKKLKKINKKI